MRSLVLCEDDVAVAEHLAAMVERCAPGRYRIERHPSLESLRDAVEEGPGPDVALLDIRLPDGSGIQMARQLFPEGSPTQVIFVTGYREYSTEVYEAEHIYFLLKPVEEAALKRALDKAERRQSPTWLIVHHKDGAEKIPMAEIRALEGRGRKVLVLCGERTVESYGSLLSLSRQLPESFVQCHKSYYVNLRHVLRMENTRLHLDNGGQVPVSRARRNEIRARFLSYLQDRHG